MRRRIGYISALAGLLFAGFFVIVSCERAQAMTGRLYSAPPENRIEAAFSVRTIRDIGAPTGGVDVLRLMTTTVVPPMLPTAVPLPTPDVPKELPESSSASGFEPEPTPVPEPKYIALTFDDGPSPAITPRVLDLLASYNAKCTFFVIGSNVRQYPELLNRMIAEGHTIGNHSNTHVNPQKVTREQLLRNLAEASQVIEDATGVRPALFRPPFGAFPRSEEKAGDMHVVFWSVDSWDWNLRDAEKTVERTIPEVQEGSIILMHDIYEPTLEAAERLLKELTAQGYTFVTVETLLGVQ